MKTDEQIQTEPETSEKPRAELAARERKDRKEVNSGLCVRCALLWPILLSTAQASAATRYVWQESPSPAPPYTNWATAAHVIQDAVDAAAPGDQVLVTNGVYATGGRVVVGVTNRVAIDRAMTVQSVNGPEVTIIQGWKVPGVAVGNSAVRCVYLADAAILSGFTLTNGSTWDGFSGEFDARSGGGAWCESTTALVLNCVLTGNNATDEGGAAYRGTLNNCRITGNLAPFGGGVSRSTLNNCRLIGNVGSNGGGAYESALNNCALNGNRAWTQGGGTYGGILNNCTVTGNSAQYGGGGGASGGTLFNCIVYFNTGPNGPNYWGGTANYSCITPLPAGTGNISAQPQLASLSHLSATSPCRTMGSAAYATGTDIDGEAWANPPSIGCDQYTPGSVTGPLTVNIATSSTTVATGYPVDFRALIEGRTTFSVWDFGDGLKATNQPYSSHAWAAVGDYEVVLWAYNESNPSGISATVTVHVIEPVHYVAADSTNPSPPYTNWATAATTIQDAVDAATLAGSVVLVTNGTYSTGERWAGGGVSNRVAVDKPLRVRSVNGPQFTHIVGSKSLEVRCVYLTNGASLSGFTLTNGATRSAYGLSGEDGGGVWCESTNAVVSNCVFTGNSARRNGGGAYSGTLNNCVLTRNLASDGAGGGAYSNVLNNCTLTGNSADQGGGAASATLRNCIVYFNTARTGANYSSSALTYSCATPLPSGTGNRSSDPLLASASHLSSTSPCRTTGSAAYVSGTDIDGEAWASPPSIGCDQYTIEALTGPLNVSIASRYTNVATGYAVW